MVAVGHPAAGRPSDRPGGPSIPSIIILWQLWHRIISSRGNGDYDPIVIGMTTGS